MHAQIALAVLSLYLCIAPCPAADGTPPDDPARLTLQRIYGSREFAGKGYSAKWIKKGAAYTTLENADGGGRDIVSHDAATGEQSVMVSAARLIPTPDQPPLDIDGYQFSGDLSRVLIYTNSKRVWRRNTRGDYWVYDRSSHDLRQLGGDAQPSTLMFAKCSPSGDRVAYVRERNIFVEDVRTGEMTQLTMTETPDVINGTFDWVYEEELGLRDGFRWSPDGRSIAFWQINTEGVQEFPLVNNTAGHYPEIQRFAYPKTGQRNPICRVGVVNIEAQNITWVNMPGDPRDHYIARMDWAGNSEQLILQQLNRLQNTNRVMLASAVSGEIETILTEIDDAWVNVHDELFWLADGQQFTWISERDGWRHVYLASCDGSDTRLMTPGEFDVVELLHVDEARERLLFLASPDNPTQRYLYSAGLDGTKIERLTPQDLSGTHSYQISADGNFGIHTYSTFDMPNVTNLVSLPEHNIIRELESNKKLHRKVDELSRTPVEFFRVDIGEGVELDGWCLKPPEFDPASKYTLLIYVYGEPANSTVRDSWGGNSYLWHLLMAQRGVIVMSLDNRGTNVPRGRQWRKSVYRQIGILGPEDQAMALRKILEERAYIDPERVGIWGWSGGGSSALHAIFKYPDLYQTAVSIAPVPNQRYYDTIYQERYMGLPSDNVDGYRDGSSINFAHQLQGNLLLIHGTGDDNCHYQTTELLINELIRHNKPFEMMAYPNRTHAIREGKNTTRHLRELMTSYLLEKLIPDTASD